MLAASSVVLSGSGVRCSSNCGRRRISPPAAFLPPEAPGSNRPPLPFLELPYFNGLGGFTPDGSEYAIYLKPGSQTPAPWVNVMANPVFGAMVSESGLGFTWAATARRID